MDTAVDGKLADGVGAWLFASPT